MSNLNLKTALYAILPLLGLVGFVASGCATTVDPQDDENVGAAEQALTPEQCEYFDVNGTVQICHSLPNGKYKMLRVNEQGCVNGHSGHGGDYVASLDSSSSLYDPTCQGLGCLPVAAPCDATLPCCDGSSCVDGACVADQVTATCPCTDTVVWGIWAADPIATAWTLNSNTLEFVHGLTSFDGYITPTACQLGIESEWKSITPAEAAACVAAANAIHPITGTSSYCPSINGAVSFPAQNGDLFDCQCYPPFLEPTCINY